MEFEEEANLATEHVVEVISLDRVMEANKALEEENRLVKLLQR